MRPPYVRIGRRYARLVYSRKRESRVLGAEGPIRLHYLNGPAAGLVGSRGWTEEELEAAGARWLSRKPSDRVLEGDDE